jgi:hypothetical protein
VALLGSTPVAVRSASALFGTLGVPAAYFWGRVVFGRSAGLLIAALSLASYWYLHESRLGMRPIALPLFLALASGLTWLAARQARSWAWPLAGLALGLSLYAYLPARRFPLVIVGQALLGLAGRRVVGLKAIQGLLGLGSLLLTATLVAVPLLLYFRASPEDATARSGVVSILASESGQANAVGSLLGSLGLNLGMFVIRGDDTIRHNLPERPVFDPLVAPFFLLGIVYTLRRRRPEHLALWLWLLVMLLPGLLSDSAPHFLRSIGLLPALFALPALGLLASASWVAERLPIGRPATIAAWISALVVTSSLAIAWRDYFLVLPRLPELGYYFDAERAALARVAGDPPPGTRLDLPTPGWSYATIRFLRSHSFEPPAPTVPGQYRFANNALLLGLQLPAQPLRPDRPARLTLYWRALREMPASLVETARVVDEFGRVWWQREGLPGLGTLPTDTWLPGETIADHLDVRLDPGTPAGSYSLEVALSQPDGGRRLAVTEGTRQVGNGVRFSDLTVSR